MPITCEEFLKSCSDPNPNSIPALSVPRWRRPRSVASASFEGSALMAARSPCEGAAPAFSIAGSSMQEAK